MSHPKDQFQVNLNLNVRGLSPSATLAINEKSNELIRQGQKVYKLGLGQSPFPVPESVVAALRNYSAEKDYLPVKGLRALRESIAKFNKKTIGLECDADDIMIGPGSKELIFILQLVYYGEILIPTPSWVSYSPQARIVSRPVNWVPTTAENKWRLTADQLEIICRTDPDMPRVIILNYPSNPTGLTYADDQLKALAEVARKYKVVVISDEIYGLLHFEGKHVSISKYYPEGTIVSTGLSKWCGAGGWRLGCFTFPPNLRWLLDAMAIVASETYTATSAPIQFAAITAFEGNEEIDEYVVQSRRVLKAISRSFVEKLREISLYVPTPDGAFYFFVDFSFYKKKLRSRGIYTSVELCNKLLEETGVAILPGSDFGRPPGEYTVRMAYVDFNGSEALKLAAGEFSEKSLDESFVKQTCPNMIEAIEQLGIWLMKE